MCGWVIVASESLWVTRRIHLPPAWGEASRWIPHAGLKSQHGIFCHVQFKVIKIKCKVHLHQFNVNWHCWSEVLLSLLEMSTWIFPQLREKRLPDKINQSGRVTCHPCPVVALLQWTSCDSLPGLRRFRVQSRQRDAMNVTPPPSHRTSHGDISYDDKRIPNPLFTWTSCGEMHQAFHFLKMLEEESVLSAELQNNVRLFTR